jgi:hypothetical protein
MNTLIKFSSGLKVNLKIDSIHMINLVDQVQLQLEQDQLQHILGQELLMLGQGLIG